MKSKIIRELQAPFLLFAFTLKRINQPIQGLMKDGRIIDSASEIEELQRNTAKNTSSELPDCIRNSLL
ncbi:Uncharacterised protein [Escherichia coli]|nr:Uncharacterised protein [Escherichia coli]